jgi:hypothetical protein
LLPEAVDDYVEADNSVRFLDAFVDGLDLAGAGFARVEAKATGRPGYAPLGMAARTGQPSILRTNHKEKFESRR